MWMNALMKLDTQFADWGSIHTVRSKTGLDRTH